MMNVLAGKHALVAEDEMYLAMMLEDVLSDAGLTVRLVARVADGLALLERESFDIALLDVNLSEEKVYPLSDRLCERGIPFVIASAYDRSYLREGIRESAFIQKPYTIPSLLRVLGEVVDAQKKERN